MLTVRQLEFLLRCLIDDGRGNEPIYVGIFGEFPGEPYKVEDLDINQKKLQLNIYQGVDMQAEEEAGLMILNEAIKKVQGE